MVLLTDEDRHRRTLVGEGDRLFTAEALRQGRRRRRNRFPGETEALKLPLNATEEQTRPLVAVVVGMDDVAAVARHPTGELPHKPRLIRANHLKDGGGSRHGMASKPVDP